MDTPMIAEKIEKIVINMLERCEFEARSKKLQIPLEDIEDRVSYYTGLPEIELNEIQEIRKLAKSSRTQPTDFNSHVKILKSLFQFYEHKEVPTFRLLYKKVNKENNIFPDFEQFKQNLALLGIKYQTIFNDTKLLMEDPEITFERYSYLKKIKQLRKQQDTHIYYVNERVIDKDMNFYTPTKQDTTGDEYVFFHALTKDCLTNSIFCLSATEDDFYKWVVDILLGSLEPSSIVVLDNSFFHSKPNPKSITMYDTKSDMQKWLRKHNVPCSDAMNKSELYELIKKHPIIEEMHRVDRVIKASGHEVLRVPRHCEYLSPIEFIWQAIRKSIKSPKDLHNEILSMFVNMGKDNYILFEKEVEIRENEMFLLDTDMDKVLDNFLINL